jgi:hypothetical protein
MPPNMIQYTVASDAGINEPMLLCFSLYDASVVRHIVKKRRTFLRQKFARHAEDNVNSAWGIPQSPA